MIELILAWVSLIVLGLIASVLVFLAVGSVIGDFTDPFSNHSVKDRIVGGALCTITACIAIAVTVFSISGVIILIDWSLNVVAGG